MNSHLPIRLEAGGGRCAVVPLVMHLAIALVTYNCLVRIARVEPIEAVSRPASGPDRYATRHM